MRVHTLNVSAPSVRADFGIPRFPRLGPTSIQLPRNLQLIAIHEDFAWLQDLGLSKFFDTQNPPTWIKIDKNGSRWIKMDQNGLCWSIYVRRGSRIPRFLGMSMRQPTTCGSKCWPLFSASSASCAAFSVIKPRGGTLKKAVGNQVKSLPHLESRTHPQGKLLHILSMAESPNPQSTMGLLTLPISTSDTPKTLRLPRTQGGSSSGLLRLPIWQTCRHASYI